MHELTDVNWINKERQACFSDQSEKKKKKTNNMVGNRYGEVDIWRRITASTIPGDGKFVTINRAVKPKIATGCLY